MQIQEKKDGETNKADTQLNTSRSSTRKYKWDIFLGIVTRFNRQNYKSSLKAPLLARLFSSYFIRNKWNRAREVVLLLSSCGNNDVSFAIRNFPEMNC